MDSRKTSLPTNTKPTHDSEHPLIEYWQKGHRRCQCLTTRGYRCNNKAHVIIPFKGGEYLACHIHNNQFFKPYQRFIK